MQNTMEYGKAFTFPQDDPNWIKKVAIAGVVALLIAVPVLGIAAAFLLWGYAVEITRRVIAGETPVLPEWTDFGDLLKKGAYYFVIGFVYALPLILLLACIGLPYGGIAFAGDDPDLQNTLATAASVVSACFGCLAALYGLLVAVVMPAAVGRLAATGQVGAALRFGDVLALVRAKPGVFVFVMIVSALAVSILSSVGSIACGIGAAWGAAYGSIAAAHLYGQAYRVASGSSTDSAAMPATM
jgi:hypothetical protein